MRSYYFMLLSVLTFTGFAQGRQEVLLTLDECIATALDRNLSIKQARNSELIAKSNQFQSLMNHLPSLNAQVNYDFFFGTTFDVNAARQVTTTTNSSNPRVSSNWVLFNGLARHSFRNQRTNEFIAAKEDVESAKISTEAEILGAYLAVILGEENIRISQERVDFLTAQLDRAKRRESVGVGSLEEVFNFQSQLANGRLTHQTLLNTYQSDKLRLLQAMQMDVTAADYSFAPLEMSDEELLSDLDPFAEILEDIMNSNPAFKSAKARQEAAKYQYRAAWGQSMPTISFFGIIGSNYSSNGAVNPNKIVTNTNGDPVPKFEPDASYFQQMKYNQFDYVNFTLSIPIFNQFTSSNRTQVAKLNMINSEIGVEQAMQTVTNTVQQGYLDMVAAQTTYESALESMDALQQSFDFMTKRYEGGNTDFYTYLESLNNKNRAEAQLANAKYTMILRKKILDTYRGID